MKLTVIMVLVATLHVSAKGFSQQVTLSEKNASLEKVFKSIKSQTGYVFFYDQSLLQNAKLVTIRVKDAPLETALNLCFENQPLTFSIVGTTIVVKQKTSSLTTDVSQLTTLPPPIDVHGRVVNEKGEPVLATVMVKGTNKGTTTNSDGYFELKEVDNNATLIVTAANIEASEIKVNGRNDLSVVNVKMKISPLDEMQIIAYGTTSKRYNTGNVTTVKSEDIQKQPVGNVLLALQGRTPGVMITQQSGIPGSAVKVEIRGTNSLRASGANDPLYVVDGVPFQERTLLGKSSTTSINGGGSPLNFINPNDIESVDILKDADATAIYGSRGGNGVIMITTKKGKQGLKVDANYSQGFSRVSNTAKLLNGPQYLEMRREAFKNDGVAPGPGDYDVNGFWDTTHFVDWQKVLVDNSGKYYNANISISNGSSNIQYRLGATYNNQTTTFYKKMGDKKVGISLNLTGSSPNKKFLSSISALYNSGNSNFMPYDYTRYDLNAAPNEIKLFNPDGSLNWELDGSGIETWTNPLSYTQLKYLLQTANLISNATLSYEIIEGLKLKALLGYNFMQIDRVQTNPLSAFLPSWISLYGIQPFSEFGKNNSRSYTIEPQLSYDRSFGQGKLRAILGTTIQKSTENFNSLNVSGFSNEALMQNPAAASNVDFMLFQSYENKYNSGYAIVNYNQGGKYLINLTARRDGSSRFGPGKQFGNFGAAGLGWIFTEENFIKRALSILSFGKIRGSYGTSGNSNLPDYGYLSLYGVLSGANFQGVTGLAPRNLPNPEYSWEVNKKLEFSLELGFFKDRLLISSSYYRNRSSNQLLGIRVPTQTGFTSVQGNFPATVQNKGMEFTVQSTNIKNRNFIWETDFNISFNKNKLLAYPGLQTNSAYIIGQPINISRVFHMVGVDPQTGIYQFVDSSGKPTFNPNFNRDRTVLIDVNPKYIGGLTNRFFYKAIELDITLQFVKRLSGNFALDQDFAPGMSVQTNQSVEVLDRWQKPGDVAKYQKYTQEYGDAYTAFTYARASDFAYRDGSFIRVKNVELSYTIPEKISDKVKLSRARVYAQAQNLFTFSPIKNLADPESGSTYGSVPYRTIVAGIQIGF